jgi:hypothetical protein
VRDSERSFDSSQRWIVGVVFLALALLTVSVVMADEGYAGRACAAAIRLIEDMPLETYADTGELPIAGGALAVDVEAVRACAGMLRADQASVWIQGNSRTTRASSVSYEIVALPGHAAEVRASRALAEARATCDETTGITVLADLTFGGNPVQVSGAPNQTFTIPGVATLVVNEHVVSSLSREITVNALHLRLETGDEFILSSARAGMACPVAAEAATWEGVKTFYR